ncbi:hypothetical protein A5724_00395 [Mycobacterium sp. ACS1612]|uniref:hypothetical protein n=1 Tax=Mycobacterium sp. ACS1612 TaxID=1834117 RepID=UPI0007FB7F5A|nr:hypothetical protein [Mycobacterium sp. ACS1612]OBF42229.1 hypothetical protein A5724_00395 [Mycobacterium sp. ACS1612]
MSLKTQEASSSAAIRRRPCPGSLKALAADVGDIKHLVSDTALAYLYGMEQQWGTGIVLTVDGGALLV